MVTEKIVEGCRVVNITPDMNKDERERVEKETVKNILREYNQLENEKTKATAQK